MKVVSKVKFADSIYKSVNKVNKENGYQLYNSVIIAQSVLETGWGQSKIMMKANALFGIKAGSGWKGKVYSSYTNEVYDGVECTEYATFRAYDSIEESIKDYYKLIKNNYKKALNCDTQRDCIQAIKNGGYATDPNYVSKIMSIINSNDFIEKYDKNEEQGTNYTIGHYVVNTDVLNVRSTPKIEDDNWLRYSQLSSNAQKQIYVKSGYKPNGLVEGVECDVSEIKKADGYTWGRIPSGWIALEYCKIEKYDKNEEQGTNYTIGHYVVNTDVLNVRSTPKIEDDNWLRYSQLSSNAQKQIYVKSGYKPNGLVEGVECDVSEIKKADGYTWGRIPSGWIALEYCKKV